MMSRREERFSRFFGKEIRSPRATAKNRSLWDPRVYACYGYEEKGRCDIDSKTVGNSGSLAVGS